MKNKIKLSKVFPLTDAVMNDLAIFSYLAQTDGGTPPEPVFTLISDFINQDNYVLLDTDYEVGFSGDKIISPLLEKILVQSLSDLGYSIEDFMDDSFNDYSSLIPLILMNYGIGNILYQRFGVKWKKIYDSLVASVYNPINNYDMEETRTPNLSTGVTANAESKTGVFGFNGTSAKDSATNDGNSSSTTTLTGTDTLTRKGNIGVTTTQQMITQELELRKHDFYRMIYMDIDSILCLKIY